MNTINIKYIMLSTLIALVSSCSTIPKGAKPVTAFEKEKFLGKWYEVARLDYKFEKGLNNNTAEYSLRDDGKIKVKNRGFKYKDNEWKEITGKAKFANADNVGMLKVSFFGPFYSGYNVIAIDKDYKYALIVGKNLKYLWILSREKTIPDDIKSTYLKIAKDVGYDTSELIWVQHSK